MKRSVILLAAIVLLSLFLRCYKIGINPPSLDWDEASLGYNAYSLLKTGKDEFGRVWPISIRSFEDYKPALYTYLTIPAVYFFGLTEFAVRLPSAIFGVLTVLVTFYLVKGLFNKNKKLALLCTLFLAISPWHIQFSRVAFEANVALFFVVCGLFCFFKGLNNHRWWYISSLFLASSFYAYHSPRLVVPLIFSGYILYYGKTIWQRKKTFFFSALLAMIILIPFMREVFTQGKSRLTSVTVITPEGRLDESIRLIEADAARSDAFGTLLHNRRIIYSIEIVKGYLSHFNLDFLFLTGDAPGRHHAADIGMLYLWEAPFVLWGLLILLKQKQRFVLMWWFLMAPAASAITTGTPHAVRALLYLPLYQIFTSLGVIEFCKYLQQVNFSLSVKYALRCLFIVIALINIFYYLDMYYVHTPVESAKDWQYGYKEAIQVMADYENSVQKVIFTYAYDQPHIYVLFYRSFDPVWYQSQWQGGVVERANRSFGKYEFRRLDWDKDQYLSKVLFIGTPEEIPDAIEGKIKDIYFPNGSVAFRIVKR